MFIYLSIVVYVCVEPVTEVVGGPELHINKGSTINLTCIVKFAPEPPPTVIWSHNRQVSSTIYNYVLKNLIIYLTTLEIYKCMYTKSLIINIDLFQSTVITQ